MLIKTLFKYKYMDKTRVDNMLIEMITPRVKEIEENFGNGKPLTQDDINTLLLKSQYNHINHLDEKLDEVVADVSSLKGEFSELKNDFKLLEQRIETTIQTALNRNMLVLVGALGLFTTISKLIDKLL